MTKRNAVKISKTAVSKFGNVRFECPSFSSPNTRYSVIFVEHKTNHKPEPKPFWFCTCKSFLFASASAGRRVPCTHIRTIAHAAESGGPWNLAKKIQKRGHVILSVQRKAA